MRIDRIGLRRFKSLYEVDVPLAQFSILTGPNGSGKSNFTAALDFLGETYLYGLEYAVGRFGGIDSIAYRRTRRTTAPVHFTVHAHLSASDLRKPPYSSAISRALPRGHSAWYKHSFSIRSSEKVGESIFSVASEEFEISLGTARVREKLLLFRSEVEDGKRRIYTEVGETAQSTEVRDLMFRRFSREMDFANYADENVAPTELLVSSLFSVPFVREFRSLMGRLKVYRLNPSACRSPGILTPNAALERDGGNLPGVIARMRRSGQLNAEARRSWNGLVESMEEIFPGLTDIQTAINSAGGLEVRLDELGVGRPWSSHEVSDGTIQYLALLAVMLDQRSPALIVEEPENALHSWMLRLFLEKCRKKQGSQVLLTTHSPVALKTVTPPEVLLAWKREGHTEIVPLTKVDPQSTRMYGEEGIDVFEQYDSGFLPQTLPSWKDH